MPKEETIRGIRKIIAERMSASWHISPRVVYSLHVDMGNVLAVIEALNKDLTDKMKKVTINHILMKTCAQAMEEYEYVNSSLQDGKIILHDTVNIGLAVAADRGLVVPNVKDVQSKSLSEVAAEANLLVDKARQGKASMDDITGGTFTITNLGMMGIESFSPIINQPEVAILGVNKIEQAPVYIDGAFFARPLMNLNFVADHRVIDGAYAAQYIRRVKELLESIE
jgi:pyruvate dehydrogenase E2 component (dihydrolipoamide acetyltransferase)